MTWVRSQGPSDLWIVMKSTVPRGSGVEFLLGDLQGPDVDYGANIEFLREEWTPEDWNAPYRIVLGAGPYASRANETVRRMYAGTESPFLIANITRVAMVKYASNAFLAIRISLLNEMAALLERSAAPLNTVETQFAADASGFSTSRFDRWYDAKWGKEKSQRKWLKAHILAGTRTNIVTSIAITSSNVHDTVMFPELLERASERFELKEVSADKAYLSDKNLRIVNKLEGYPYIPFKSNTTGNGSELWRKMYKHFVMNEEEWAEHYHRRSNVETTFSMVKSKFGDAVRAKSDTGQVNEILLKFLCHNICVLIQEMYELGISPDLSPVPKLDISLN